MAEVSSSTVCGRAPDYRAGGAGTRISNKTKKILFNTKPSPGLPGGIPASARARDRDRGPVRPGVGWCTPTPRSGPGPCGPGVPALQAVSTRLMRLRGPSCARRIRVPQDHPPLAGRRCWPPGRPHRAVAAASGVTLWRTSLRAESSPSLKDSRAADSDSGGSRIAGATVGRLSSIGLLSLSSPPAGPGGRVCPGLLVCSVLGVAGRRRACPGSVMSRASEAAPRPLRTRPAEIMVRFAVVPPHRFVPSLPPPRA